jgi:hypothetical protein
VVSHHKRQWGRKKTRRRDAWELARMPRPETRILKADALAIKLRILYI